MKKLMALVTALLLICTLAACGGAPLKKPSEQDTLALLRQAGFTNTTTLGALDTVSLLYDNDSALAQVAQQLQKTWENKLGIKVQLKRVERNEMKARLSSGEFVLALMEMTASYNDASAYLDPWRSSDMRNYGMQYLNAYDILMQIAAGSSSPAILYILGIISSRP